MTPGTLLVDPNFRFHDGEQAEKILVALGTSRGLCVVAKATSKGRRFRNDFGCQAEHRFPNFHLPAGSCCLPLPTWICLDDYYEFKLQELMQRSFSGEIRRMGLIPDKLTESLVRCALGSADISMHQRQILQEALDRFLGGLAAGAD